MYLLTLTLEERKAFDWVGNRYNSREISQLLIESLEDQELWWEEGNLTFNLPESIAWAIDILAKEENCEWPCFSDELKAKMNKFLESIV